MYYHPPSAPTPTHTSLLTLTLSLFHFHLSLPLSSCHSFTPISHSLFPSVTLSSPSLTPPITHSLPLSHLLTLKFTDQESREASSAAESEARGGDEEEPVDLSRFDSNLSQVCISYMNQPFIQSCEPEAEGGEEEEPVGLSRFDSNLSQMWHGLHGLISGLPIATWGWCRFMVLIQA